MTRTRRLGGMLAAVAAGIVIGAGRGEAQQALTFSPPAPFEMSGSQPKGIAVGDFNGDGHLDLAVTSSVADQTNGVTVLFGNGQGRFAESENFFAPNAWAIAVGDVNMDGILDLVVGARVYLGTGDGKFTLKAQLAAGSFPIGVVVGDFNEDGVPDVAVAGNIPGGVSVFIGAGDGTFGPAMPVPGTAYLNGTGMTVADVDRDGHLDLVVSHYGGVAVFRGAGDGTFVGGGGAGGSALTQAVAVGDLNGDGHPDVASVELYADRLLVSLGAGDGTFQYPTPYVTRRWPSHVAVADLNGDGVNDVVVVSQDGRAVQIFLGNGNGTLAPPQDFPVGIEPEVVAIGDWNNDSRPDLAVADRNYGDTPFVSIMLQQASVIPDGTPPAVAVTSPGSGAVVANTIAVTASATDNVGVTRVEFYAGNQLIGTSAGPAFTASWNTLAVADGPYDLSAAAFDAAGNRGTSAPVRVTVSNAAPAFTSVPPVVNVNVGSLYSYQVTTTGRTPQTFTLATAPAGMAIGTTGLVTWRPAAAQLGANAVSIRASNAVGSAVQSFTVPVVDSSAPSAPTGLVVSDLGETSVTLRWNASVDNVGVAAYRLYEYRTVNRYSSGWYLVADNIPGTSTTVSGLVPGSTHKYDAAAFDAAGNTSARSSTLSLTTLAPKNPTNVTASQVTTTSVTLTWGPSPGPVPIVKYAIWREIPMSGSPNQFILMADNITDTSATVGGLTPNTVYYLGMRAYDAHGHFSSGLPSTSVRTSAPPVPRVSLAYGESIAAVLGDRLMIVGPQVGVSVGKDVVVKASELPAPTYALVSGPAGMVVEPVTGKVTWSPVSGVTPGTSTATVRATNSAGTGDVTFSYTVYPAGTDLLAPGRTGIPTIAGITRTGGALSWTPATDNVAVVGYEVWAQTPPPRRYRTDPPAGTPFLVGTTPGTGFTLTTLTPAAKYRVYVIPYDAAGNKGLLSAVIFTTLP